MSLTYADKKTQKDSGTIGAIVWIFLGSLVAYGVFGLYQLITASPEVAELFSELFSLGGDFFKENLTFIFATIILLFVAVVLFSIFQIYILSFIGAEFVVTIVFGVPILVLLAGLAAVAFGASAGTFLLIPGIILCALVYWFRTRLIFGAKFFEYSTEVVMKNKSCFVPMLLVALVNMIGGILFFGASSYTWYAFRDDENVAAVALALVSLAYLIGQYIVRYYAEAINVSIFFRWYKDFPDRTLGAAMKDAKEVRSTIFAFAVLMAFLAWIRKLIRDAKQSKSSKGGGIMIAAVIIRGILFFADFMVAIFEFLTYYTLPVIVIEKKPLKESVYRSGSVVSRSVGSVIGGAIGIGLASALYKFFNFIFLVGIGGYFGYTFAYQELLADTVVAGDAAKLGMGILMAVVFLIFGYYPMSILFTPVRTAFSTLLFTYLADKEANVPPSDKLSKDLQQEMDKIFSSPKYVKAHNASATRHKEVYGGGMQDREVYV